MKTQVAKIKKDGDDNVVAGWSAEAMPGYDRLLAVLEELKSIEDDGVAEIGFVSFADYNDEDEDEDGIGIVWANYPYFTDGNGSLRDMRGWVAIDGDHYFGCNLNGEEWKVPFIQSDAAAVAARKLLEDDLAD